MFLQDGVKIFQDEVHDFVQMELTGTMSIDVEENGYRVNIPSANKEIFLPIEKDKMIKNRFGFISEHYMHGCGYQRIF